MKLATLLLAIITSFSVMAAIDIDSSRGEKALEAFNFLSGIEVKDLTASQQQLYKQGMERLQELARVLNFQSFEAEESLEISSNSICNEFYLLKVQEMALDNARKSCQTELTEGFECIDFSSKVVRNVAGGCQAIAAVHRVKTIKDEQ